MTKTILLALAVIGAGFYILAPNDAECEDCWSAGQACYGNVSCLGDCHCIRINGNSKPGFCG
jgi:hypothetical protein